MYSYIHKNHTLRPVGSAEKNDDDDDDDDDVHFLQVDFRHEEEQLLRCLGIGVLV